MPLKIKFNKNRYQYKQHSTTIILNLKDWQLLLFKAMLPEAVDYTCQRRPFEVNLLQLFNEYL